VCYSTARYSICEGVRFVRSFATAGDMLERVQRAWDRLHHRPLVYRRVGVSDSDDAAVDDSGEMSEDWRPMMTASLYCPGPEGELVADCRRQKAERRPSTDPAVDDADWCSLTLGRAQRRCRCRYAATSTDKAAVVGDHAVSVGEGIVQRHETLPWLKSPILGRRLRTLVGDDHPASVASGSASCPGSPRDVARLSAVIGRRLQLGLSPRLATRRTNRHRDNSVNQTRSTKLPSLFFLADTRSVGDS